MNFEVTPQLLVMAFGGFLLGLFVSALASRIGMGMSGETRDPRDKRILSLEAELRIAATDLEAARETVEFAESSVKEFEEGIAKRDAVIAHQQKNVEKMKLDLKESIRKTRELRAELTDRATQGVRSEARIREVETELSVAQASTDMIATGVLDYSLAPDKDES
jgi:hypothetical protein